MEGSGNTYNTSGMINNGHDDTNSGQTTSTDGGASQETVLSTNGPSGSNANQESIDDNTALAPLGWESVTIEDISPHDTLYIEDDDDFYHEYVVVTPPDFESNMWYNVWYQEFQDLQDEFLGNVNSGLNEYIIFLTLYQYKYQPGGEASAAPSTQRDCCCICLEEYVPGDNIGRLDNCVHEYHATCISKWIGQNNSCPICKAVALTTIN